MRAKRAILAGAGVAALLMIAVPDAAEAQGLRGRLGRAVKDRLGNDDAAAAPAPTPVTPTTSRNPSAGFTAEQLDSFAAGLAVEVERRSALAAEVTALQPRPNYEQCRLEWGMSADGQRAYAAYTEAVSAAFADAQNTRKQEEMERALGTLEQAVRKSCGPSPDDAPRLIEARQGEPENAGAERAGLKRNEYARLKELVMPFCAVADSLDAGSEAAIPSGAGKSYSYSAEDTRLLKPRCEQLLPLLQATL